MVVENSMNDRTKDIDYRIKWVSSSLYCQTRLRNMTVYGSRKKDANRRDDGRAFNLRIGVDKGYCIYMPEIKERILRANSNIILNQEEKQ